jgi:soluble cytochrome b562
MKAYIIIFAAVLLCCSTVYAMEDCETKYMEVIKKIEASDKLSDSMKKKLASELQEPLKLCKEGKTEEAKEAYDDVKDSAFLELYKAHQSLYGQ